MITRDDISQAPMKTLGSWELIKYQLHFFPERGLMIYQGYKDSQNIRAQQISMVLHTSIHELFTHLPSIYTTIMYPFFIHPFKWQQFIHYLLTIHLAKHPFILHSPSISYPSSRIHHQPTIHLPILHSVPIPHKSIYHPYIHSAASHPASHRYSICVSTYHVSIIHLPTIHQPLIPITISHQLLIHPLFMHLFISLFRIHPSIISFIV